MPDEIAITATQAVQLAESACRGAGASPRMARILAAATISAELHDKRIVGLAHLVDYLDALQAGRIDGAAEPRLHSPAPALIACNAGGGIAQLGFDDAFEALCERALSLGIALFAQANSYTAGELGWYVRRLADAGLVALAGTNGPPLMQPPGGSAPVYCTNPIAFAAPGAQGAALVIDQSCSQTAYIGLRRAAESGAAIPEGWAVDAAGRPTTDPNIALGGALLTFGGARGANLALMVEILAAGLSGANWSLDSPSFSAGARGPGAGLTVVAIAPTMLDPGFTERLESQLRRLGEKRVYIPGASRRGGSEFVRLSADLLTTLQRYAANVRSSS